MILPYRTSGLDTLHWAECGLKYCSGGTLSEYTCTATLCPLYALDLGKNIICDKLKSLLIACPNCVTQLRKRIVYLFRVFSTYTKEYTGWSGRAIWILTRKRLELWYKDSRAKACFSNGQKLLDAGGWFQTRSGIFTVLTRRTARSTSVVWDAERACVAWAHVP